MRREMYLLSSYNGLKGGGSPASEVILSSRECTAGSTLYEFYLLCTIGLCGSEGTTCQPSANSCLDRGRVPAVESGIE